MFPTGWLLESDLASWVNRRLPVNSRVVDFFDRGVRRDPTLVLFGAMNGRKFGDNSRYVYEWVLENRNDLNPLWITLDEAVKSQLDDEGKPVELATSPAGIKALFRAGAAMTTNNFYDIALHPVLVPSSLNLIHLGHGIPVKRGADNQKQRTEFEEAYKEKRSELAQFKIYTSTFLMEDPDSKVNRVTGYPRNDPLLKPPKTAQNNWDEYNEENQSRSSILYAPTWRHGRQPTEFFPFEDFSPEELDDVLQTIDSQLLLRPHRNELRMYDSLQSELERYASQCERVRLATHNEFPDANALLPFIDCLITDYSGIYHDYLLLDRPILFIPYDYEDYDHHNGFRYDYFNHLPGPAIDDFDEFLTAIERAIENDAYYEEERRTLKEKIHHYDDGESSRRVVELLDEILASVES